MINFFRTSLKSLLAIALILTLGACSTGGAAGLEPFKSQDGRYGFLFPTGWTRVAVDNGPEVVYHDLINSDETLSLVISKLDNEVDLDDLGGADAVGERLFGENNPFEELIIPGPDQEPPAGEAVNAIEGLVSQMSKLD